MAYQPSGILRGEWIDVNYSTHRTAVFTAEIQGTGRVRITIEMERGSSGGSPVVRPTTKIYEAPRSIQLDLTGPEPLKVEED